MQKNKVNLEGNTMKFTKLLATAAAVTMMAAVALPVSANTINPTNAKAATADTGKESWEAIYGWDDYVDASTIPDGDLTVTVNFEWSDKGMALGYTAFKPMIAYGSEGVYKQQLDQGKTYITGVPYKEVDTHEDEKDADGNALNSTTGWLDADGKEVKYQIQDDGFLQVLYTEEDTVTSVTFTLTSDFISDLKNMDTILAEEPLKDTDGNEVPHDWDGFNIQAGNNGITITSVEYSADVKLHSEVAGDDTSSSQPGGDTSSSTASKDSSSTTTSTAGTTKTGTNNAGGTTAAAGGSDATDTQAATGATAGLVFAGIALAGAAVVVTKRK